MFGFCLSLLSEFLEKRRNLSLVFLFCSLFCSVFLRRPEPEVRCTRCIKIALRHFELFGFGSALGSVRFGFPRCLYGFVVIKDGQVIMTFLAGHPITCDRAGQEIGKDQRGPTPFGPFANNIRLFDSDGNRVGSGPGRSEI